MFSKLTLENKILVKEAVNRFVKNPFDRSLNTHKLEWKFKGQWSFSADYDLRVVFEECDWFIEILFLRVWNHKMVYRK